MNKHLVVSLAALAAISACSDVPTFPSASLGSVDAPLQSHVWQAGSGSAWHGYDAPTLSWNGGKACAAWSDWAIPETADHFSFEFERLVDDVWEAFAKVNNDDGGVVCTAEELPEGDYRLRGMAKDGKGTTTTTHHTVSFEFSVGGVVYEFVRIAASNNNTETAAPGPLGFSKTGAVVLWAVLYRNGELVEDCTTVPIADATATITYTAPGSATATVAAAECGFNGAAQRHRYKFELGNTFNNQESAGTIELKVGGNVVTTYAFTRS